jgi:hypothetical protein
MKQRIYLDVISAFEAGYSTAFDNFSWPIPQQTYDSVARAFIDFLESLLVSPSLSESERFDLALSITPIANESFFFSGSHMMMDICDRNGQEPVFSPNGLYYPVIAEYRCAGGGSVSEYLLQMQKDRSKSFAAKFVRPYGKRLRQYQLAARSFVTRPRVYHMASNKLMNEWLAPEHVGLAPLISSTGSGNEQIGRNQPVRELSSHIAENFGSIVASHGFGTDQLLLEYIRRTASIHLSNAKFWREKNHERFFNTRDSILLAPTAGGFVSRLMSHVFQRNELPVVRFTHGGERGLIDDPRWHYPELMFTDSYIVHGRTEATQVADAVRRKTSILTSKNLQVVGAGSKFHSRLRIQHGGKKTSGRVRNVMVVTASMTGEIRPAFVSKAEEVTYLEWHLRLLESIRGDGYNVVSKRHPKGSLSSTKLFGGIASDELTDSYFTDQLKNVDAFVFDFAASAFMEALCTNKPVVLIETPYRPLLPTGRAEVASTCTIVTAEYDQQNRLVMDFGEVIRGLEEPVDAQLREAFVENYLLQPSENIGQFTDLLARG